jgi:hypothetical protein
VHLSESYSALQVHFVLVQTVKGGRYCNATTLQECTEMSPETSRHLSVVGTLPQGLPAFRIPDVTSSDCVSLVSGALAISLVSIADMSALSRIFALREGYYVDENQELVALGIANVATGFFQGFSVSSSASRTPIAESAGAKTQMTCITGAVCFAEMKGPVKDYLKRYGLFSKLGVDNFFPTIGQAVDHYLLRHPVVWHDWDDDKKSEGTGA